MSVVSPELLEDGRERTSEPPPIIAPLHGLPGRPCIDKLRLREVPEGDDGERPADHYWVTEV